MTPGNFVRLLYPHGAVRRVMRGYLKGCLFVVRPGLGATLAWGLDNMQLPFLARKLKPGQVVYDVGANCGQMAMFFSRMTGPSGKVIAFEPVPGNLEVARRNLALNGMSNVTLHEVALASEPGEKEFLFDPARHTMGVFRSASVKLNDWNQSTHVRCESIDLLISAGLPEPDVIKVDVEGAAAEVLGGAKELLRRRKPAIYLELHAANHESPEWKLMEELKACWNYRIEDVCGTLKDEPGVEWTGAVWCE